VASETAPDVGTQLGAYRLEAVLGRGGMGVVYRATDMRLGRRVALKVLPAQYGGDETFRARLERESRVAASIDHPGVIPIYEAGEADGQLYIAMRHVDGVDLGALLRQEGALEPERAVELVSQLAEALDAAHAAGLVHRDIKPSNALIGTAGGREHVYLSDFGLSKEATGDTTLSGSGALVGTVKYMAPEVIRTGLASPRSDIYSLGCLLFECLAGRAPYPGPTEPAVIYGHLEEPPPRVTDVRPSLPRAFDAVLARALHKDPERRWRSGAELAQAARAALTGTAPRVRPRPALLAAAFGALALIAVGAVLAGWNGGADLAQIRPDHVAVIDPGDGSLTGQVAFGGTPGAVAAGAGSLWAADADRGVLTRIDARSRERLGTIPVGHEPAAIAVAGNGVWVANRPDGTLSVISARTNEVVRTVRAGRSVDGVCAGAGAVWAASPIDHAVMRFSAATGRRTATVRLSSQPARVACTDDAIWVSSPTAGTVTEISARAATAVRTIQVGRGATAVAASADGVWVVNPAEGIVSRIDPARGVVTATVALGAADGPSEIAIGGDAVWVSNEFRGAVTRIDPEAARIAEELEIGHRPLGLAVVGGALWVAVGDTGARHRGGTLRVEYEVAPRREEYDPALGFGFASLTNDGLVGYRRRAGSGGTVLVANLAESVPAPSDGGRTYTFRLRRGLVYSNGEPVAAGDFRFALERALRFGIAGGYFAAIRGAARCTRERCDLSRGIASDDATRTIVVRLEEPDPDLLYKLALPYASLLPRSIGGALPAEVPLPATGPYRYAEIGARTTRLVRNPRFRSWSETARPDGYPDEILVHFGAGDQEAAERLVRGRADILGPLFERSPETVARLRNEIPARLRESVAPFTVYFVLNTRVAPFDDVDARRAVAFAFDRRAAVAAAGTGAARETCQLLPPGFLGSRPYCPFTLPESAGASGRPNLATARRLVRRSGTRGARVVVQAPALLPSAVPRLMVRTLRRLGYDATLRLLSPEAHFGSLGDTGKRVQIGLLPWIADYPAPSTFLDNFKCAAIVRNDPANLNASQFCDREVDQLMAQAGRLQAVDPTAADELWAQAERRIVDQAPLVAAYNPLYVTAVSERAGNYQANAGPLFGELLDQVWVR
jgi:YVTN family beta-propeller protein